MKLIISIVLLTLNFCHLLFAETKGEQEINGFSLVQYEDGGEKTWELYGKAAKIEDANVKIDEVSAVSFGKESALKLKAKVGDLDRKKDVVHLKEGVLVKTTDGTSLSTEYLDWEREKKTISTNASVEIRKSNFQVEGKGATCNLEEKKTLLEEDIRADFKSQGLPYLGTTPRVGSGQANDEGRTTITCDGPLELNYKKYRATFKNNVEVKDAQGNIYADRIDVYFKPDTRRVKCVVARGNVKIFNGNSTTYSQKAIYLVEEGRIILPSRPKLVIDRNETIKE